MYLPAPQEANGVLKLLPECTWCISKDIKDSRVYPVRSTRDATTNVLIEEAFACSNGHEWVEAGGFHG